MKEEERKGCCLHMMGHMIMVELSDSNQARVWFIWQWNVWR